MVQKDSLIHFFSKNFEIACSSESQIWSQLKNSNIFITGGTGFFGCWLIRFFQWANLEKNLGVKLHILTRNRIKFLERYPEFQGLDFVKYTQGDVRNYDFPKKPFTHLIHAATDASARLNQENPLLMLDTITEGTRRTLEFAKYFGIKRILFTSSGAVYGKQPPELSHIPESYLGAPYVLNPSSAYGEGKRLAEHYCSIYSNKYHLEIVIARCFAFSGPYLPWNTHFALGNFLRDCTDSQVIKIQGDGTPYRSYLYGADLAFWLATLLAQGKTLDPYHIGSEKAFSIQEIAQAVAQEASQFGYGPIQIQIANQAIPERLAERYIPSTLHTRESLNLVENFTFPESIRQTLLWHQQRKFNEKD